ncbi:transcription cofactor vestigial-like protein 2a isoform X2 [Hoplias malabaricus]|uniref:transcription cofactor vestigial-like protein 2a isoform X2 n=1 Tax=Hoplias malabaricus TaxID=27720 RepID=UPI003462D675
MSCLDVMYQVYASPQPYFTATYSPYHHQKLASFYSKMQEAQDAASGSSSFSSAHTAPVKEEETRDPTPEAEYLSARCVLFTYFRGDISSVVDEHFSRALSQAAGHAHSSSSSKITRGATSWKDGSFPMSQRSFPPSFWNSAYQPSVTATLSSALGASQTELPFTADPYSTASLHTHLHQATPEPWHPPHHHHHHPHPYSLSGAISTQSSAYPRPSVHDMYGTHFDPRYGSLLVPSVRPHRLPTATVPAPGPSPCDISKTEPTSSAWTGAFTGTSSDMGQGLSLNVDTARRYALCGRGLLS